MLGKLIKQSETGKCLVIGTIMADRLIIKQQKIPVCKREYYVANRIKVVLNMFTVGTDVLGCSKSDRLWFLLKGRNQSFSYLPISTSVGSYCQHMRANSHWSRASLYKLSQHQTYVCKHPPADIVRPCTAYA